MMTIYALTLVRDSIDPRWFRQHVDRDFDECVVGADGTIELDGYRFRFSDGGEQLPAGTCVQVWFGRWVTCRPMHEVYMERAERAAAQHRADYLRDLRTREQRLVVLRQRLDAEAFNAQFTLPVPWTTGRKDVLSGLSERSAGDGCNRATVVHILLRADLADGRLKRQSGSFLCGDTGKQWSGDPTFLLYDADHVGYQPAVTCKTCLRLAERYRGADDGVSEHYSVDDQQLRLF